jgi:hypothetical protein
MKLRQKLAIKYRKHRYGEEPRSDHTSEDLERSYEAGYQRLYGLIEDFSNRFLTPEQKRAVKEWDKEQD